MTVHFPIVFMFSTTIFNLLFVLTGIEAFETTAIDCLGAGILFTPIAILTGLYPPGHGVRENVGYVLDDSIPTLAGISVVCWITLGRSLLLGSHPS